jgi:pyruvate kinase
MIAFVLTSQPFVFQIFIAILLDTKGPEIRSGFFANGASKLDLTKGETIILTTDYEYRATDATKLGCSYPSLATSVTPGQQILVADGSLVLTVLSCDIPAGQISCRIENNCSLGERKNMNLPGCVVDLPTFTKQDISDIVDFGIHHKVDFVAASFVRKARDVTNLRQLLAENGGQGINIICKIENQEGMENYGEILQATDAIMVARGDLGMEIPPAKVFLAQKMMIREANIAGKPVSKMLMLCYVVVATRMQCVRARMLGSKTTKGCHQAMRPSGTQLTLHTTLACKCLSYL